MRGASSSMEGNSEIKGKFFDESVKLTKVHLRWNFIKILTTSEILHERDKGQILK